MSKSYIPAVKNEASGVKVKLHHNYRKREAKGICISVQLDDGNEWPPYSFAHVTGSGVHSINAAVLDYQYIFTRNKMIKLHRRFADLEIGKFCVDTVV